MRDPDFVELVIRDLDGQQDRDGMVPVALYRGPFDGSTIRLTSNAFVSLCRQEDRCVALPLEATHQQTGLYRLVSGPASEAAAVFVGYGNQ